VTPTCCRQIPLWPRIGVLPTHFLRVRPLLLPSLLAPRAMSEWTTFVTRFYGRYVVVPPSKKILTKPLHRYLRAGLMPRARLRLMRRHFEIVADRFSPAFIKEICLLRQIPLANLTYGGERFRIHLCDASIVQMAREGEIAFCLVQLSSGVMLAKMSTLFDQRANAPILVIGGLQGAQGAKAAIVSATRKLHGLRPKDALLLAVRSFASVVGCAEVHAISNERQMMKRRDPSRVRADYDAYWLERGARPAGDYGFVFNAHIPEVVGGKRRDTVKRDIVETVRHQVLLGLRQLNAVKYDRDHILGVISAPLASAVAIGPPPEMWAPRTRRSTRSQHRAR
jgi:uncharacterized protein VirK/YbjX